MRKLVYLIAILLLGLSSCKKNDNPVKENTDEPSLVINGKKYTIAEIKELVSGHTGVAVDRLIYDDSDTTITIEHYEGIRYKIVEIINLYK